MYRSAKVSLWNVRCSSPKRQSPLIPDRGRILRICAWTLFTLWWIYVSSRQEIGRYVRRKRNQNVLNEVRTVHTTGNSTFRLEPSALSENTMNTVKYQTDWFCCRLFCSVDRHFCFVVASDDFSALPSVNFATRRKSYGQVRKSCAMNDGGIVAGVTTREGEFSRRLGLVPPVFHTWSALLPQSQLPPTMVYQTPLVGHTLWFGSLSPGAPTAG